MNLKIQAHARAFLGTGRYHFLRLSILPDFVLRSRSLVEQLRLSLFGSNPVWDFSV